MEDGIRHQLVVDDADVIAEISTMFESVPALYVADGHHRTAQQPVLLLTGKQ